MYFIVASLYILTAHLTVCVCHAALKGHLLAYLLAMIRRVRVGCVCCANGPQGAPVRLWRHRWRCRVHVQAADACWDDITWRSVCLSHVSL